MEYIEEDYVDAPLITVSELIGAGGNWLVTVGLGGYEITFLDEQDNVLCGDCADEAFYLGSRDIAGGFMHWEGPALSCHECDDEIPSIFGDKDEEEE